MSNNDKKTDSPNNGNFDLSGVFHVQRKYLTDLSNSYPNVNNAPLVANYVLELQKKVKNTGDSYKKANTSADNILTEQNKMINIVDSEQKRLEKKKILIDQVESEERRKALLTESNRLRKADYTKIIMVFILCVIIHIALFLLIRYIYEPPVDSGVSTIFTLLHLFNFAILTLVAFYIYIDIQSRSHINYNKLELPPPSLVNTGSAPTQEDYGNLFKDLGLCYSDGCCGENTFWDKQTGLCLTDNLISTPESNIESFVVNNSLNLCPKFNVGKTSEEIKIANEMAKKEKKKEKKSIDATGFDRSTFDPKNASIEDVRKNTKLDVQDKFKEILGPTMGKIKNIRNSMSELEPKPLNTDEFDDLGNNMLEGAIPGEGKGGKCYFTTMEDAHEIQGCNKANRMVYYPSSDNNLLPVNNHLDNEVYYKGLNHSKELTDRFSNYK